MKIKGLIFSIVMVWLRWTLPCYAQLSQTASPADEIEYLIQNAQIDSLLKHVRELSGEVPIVVNGQQDTITSRYSGDPGNPLAAAYLMLEFSKLGYQPVLQNVDEIGWGQNVIVERRGTRYPDQKFILCAHYDCYPWGLIAPGADDNASGTAAVLEIARLLKQRDFPYTIVFALWDQEEQGLVGSKYYAQQAALENEKIQGVINMDMIAWDGNKDDEVELHVKDIAQSMYLSERMQELNVNYDINLNLHVVMPGGGGSDQASFWQKGFGAILLIEDYTTQSGKRDFNPYYHTIKDRIMIDGQYIFDLDYYSRCAKLALATFASFVLDAAPPFPMLMANNLRLPVRTALNWNRVSEATNYSIQICTDNSFPESITRSAQVFDTTQYVGGLDFNKEYFYRVRARNRAGSSVWSPPGFFTTTGPIMQTVELTSGWNLISLNVAPIDSAITSLVSPLGNNLRIIQDGGGLQYWPEKNLKGITTWHNYFAYWVFSRQPALWTVSGALMNTIPSPIPLNPGWNNMAYWPADPSEVGSALASIQDGLVLLKDGNGEVYWPELQINEIDELKPGQGYQVYLRAADTLVYPVNDSGLNSLKDGMQNLTSSPHHYIPPQNTCANAILLAQANELIDGDEIAAWTQDGLLVGSGVAKNHQCPITLWADNIATPVVDGAVNSDIITLTSWSNEKQIELVLSIEQYTDVLTGSLKQAPLRYQTDAVNIARVSVGEGSPTTFALMQNYPNPFKDRTFLEYTIPEEMHVTLNIYNVRGQLVAKVVDELKAPRVYREPVNLKDLPSGLYYAQLQGGGKQHQVKMMVVR